MSRCPCCEYSPEDSEEYDNPFIEIETKQGDGFLHRYGSGWRSGEEDILLLCCPECGIVFRDI